jgi:iron complex transport system substrate-binding protein
MALALCLLCASCAPEKQARPAASAAPAQRIVSLVPSITETLFALGVGDRVVGVTKFCSYPPEATKLPKIGGQVDPNAEAIALLEPDLVVLFDYQDDIRKQVEALGIPTLAVPGKSLANVLALIDRLGEACGCVERANELRASLESRIEAVRQRCATVPEQPRVLVSVDRVLGGGLRGIYAAGDEDYFTTLLEIAGARNACSSTGIAFPMLSPESVVEINPDAIVDLCVGAVGRGISKDDVRKDWLALQSVPAVQNNRIWVVTETFATVPGPRSVEFLEALADFLHPVTTEGKP